MACTPVQLSFDDFGQGVPLILIHGFPLDRSIWTPVVEMLKPHARVILPDLRGFGQSPLGEEVSTMRLMAEDIAALMDTLGIEKAVLAGHSMGGYVCLNFARAYPRRLLGLGLVATQAAADTLERRQARLATAAEMKRKGIRVVANSMPQKLTTQVDFHEPLKKLIQKNTVKGVQAALLGMAERPDATDWLAEITVPTAVIAGAQDTLISPERSKTMAQMLNHAWLVEISNASHMPMMEAPQEVAEALLQLVRLSAG